MNSNSQKNHLYYQGLPTDFGPGCLSYLAPAELSRSVKDLSMKSAASAFDEEMSDAATNAVVEHAAWLSIASMVATAEKYWEGEPEYEAEAKATHRGDDTVALGFHSIISEDPSVIGDLLRSSFGGDHCHPPPRAGRFRDETWQNLYDLLYRVLFSTGRILPRNDDEGSQTSTVEASVTTKAMDDISWIEIEFFSDDSPDTTTKEDYESDDDIEQPCHDDFGRFYEKEAIALAVGLVLGAPTIPEAEAMSESRRRCLEEIAASCARLAKDDYFVMSSTRCFSLAQQLASHEFWDDALVTIARSGLILTDGGNNDASLKLLRIDASISLSAFLIDRWNSRTGLPNNSNDEKDLALAVRLGRRAVKAAAKRYRTTKSGDVDDDIESLFAADAHRLIHAKLALGRALSLLAEQTGRGTFPVGSLRKNGVRPLPIEDDIAIMVAMGDMPLRNELEIGSLCEWHQYGEYERRKQIGLSNGFFRESLRQLRDGTALCERGLNKEPADAALAIGYGALLSAAGEWSYHRSSVSATYGTDPTTEHFALASISKSCDAVRFLTEWMLASMKKTPSTALRSSVGGRDATLLVGMSDAIAVNDAAAVAAATPLDTLLRCAKNLRTVCRFADEVGVDCGDHLELEHVSTSMNRDLRVPSDRSLLRFAHRLSLYQRHESFRDSSRRRPQTIQKLAATAA